MNLRDLVLRVRALLTPRRVDRELDEELAFHIERETQKHIADGLSPAAARTRARARFGSVPLAADQCRDARGTAFVDTLASDMRYAFRTFRRAPLAALTIVATMALGLGLITVVFTVFNTFFLRVDAVSRPGELFAVDRPLSATTTLRFTQREYETLRRENNVFTGVIAMLPDVSTRIEGRRMNGTLVTGNFFDVLAVPAKLGRPLTPSDDAHSAGRPVIVLSHSGWTKLFAGARTAIGSSLRANGRPYEIVGVMPEDFRGLSVTAPDFWAPLALVGQFQQGFGWYVNGQLFIDDIVGRLRSGVSPSPAAAALTAWASGHPELRTDPRGRPTSIRLTPRRGTLSADVVNALMRFSPVFIAFGLILLIGCANVANLLLARGVARQREIAVRLSLGAPRRRIVRQLLTENFLLAFAAAAGGFVVSRLFLVGGFNLVIAAMPPQMAEYVSFGPPSSDWRVGAFLAAGAVISTMCFGLLPALQTTRLALPPAMRSEVKTEAGPRRVRYTLIAAQVGASSLLLVGAAVFLRGALDAATADLGLRTSDTVTVPITTEPKRAEILHEVMAHPSVAMVASSSPGVGEVGATRVEVPADEPEKPATQAPAAFQFVTPEYFTVLGIDLLKGRRFAPAERSLEAGVVVVSERIAQRFWPGRNAVGRVVRLRIAAPGTASPVVRSYSVVGMVQTVAHAKQGPFIFNGADLYLPMGMDDPGTSLTVRVHGDPDLARRLLLERLTEIDPAIGDVGTLRARTGMTAYVLRTAFWLTVVLGCLALLLTLSGLFSVLSYLVAQRTKEIGVRMALGATTRNVAGLVLRQSLAPVGVGVVVGGVLAASLAAFLMSTPAGGLIEDIIHVYDPAAYAASLLVIVTACALAASIPTLRAARIDPITTLRND